MRGRRCDIRLLVGDAGVVVVGERLWNNDGDSDAPFLEDANPCCEKAETRMVSQEKRSRCKESRSTALLFMVVKVLCEYRLQ